jgi:predicted O-methyltransferase YrrM
MEEPPEYYGQQSSPKGPRSDLHECGKAHGPDWLKWLGHLIDKPCTGMELGTWKGESAEWFLEHICAADGSRFYCVDNFEGSVEHHLAGIDCSQNADEAKNRLVRFFSKAAIWKTTTVKGLHFARNVGIEFDFIYIDAAHDAQNVLRDSILAFDLLKIGGTLIWDDYLWNVMPEPTDCPKLAIDGFLAAYGKQIEIVSFGGWQCCVRKTR